MLVVEDDEDIALALQRSLRMEGYEVRLAGDGEAALDEAVAFMPDMVILDLGLPKLDGIEVARRLRADGDVPILMLTARDALDSRVEGLDVGADDYLVKPFERQELLARLRALLRRRPPRGSRSLRRRRPVAEPRHPRGPARRARRRADPARVRAARVPHAQRAHRRAPPAPARGGLGLRPVRDDEHHRGLRVQPQDASWRPVVSRGSSTRSAARATSSALDRDPDPLAARRRLGAPDAGHPLRLRGRGRRADRAAHPRRLRAGGQATRPTAARATSTSSQIDIGTYKIRFRPNLDTFVAGDDAAARLVGYEQRPRPAREPTARRTSARRSPQSTEYRGYRVENRCITASSGIEPLVIQYGAPEGRRRGDGPPRAAVPRRRRGRRRRARAARRPDDRPPRDARRSSELTDTAREIERTRDPSQRDRRTPPADDEVAELARTLDGMLRGARRPRATEQEAMLRRQREFVADASHELRTPLTSVLANLDFLAETLDGEQGDAAALGAALRRSGCAASSRTCCCSPAPTPRRAAPHQPLDLGAGRSSRPPPSSSRSPTATTLTVDAPPRRWSTARATSCTASC